ncbi:MAG TPA: peptidylprolyl isomerase [Candidatus Pacearchaeota archaeon]|nr:peptidylprolyl isomerase [Candidatus Pacearchaeota archaeon]
MTIKEKDFIQIDFTGKVVDGEIFDSTIKEDLEKLHAGHDHPVDVKPLVFGLGQGMFLKALDEFLVGKETGKTYEVDLEPEKAFGNRDPKLINMIPMKIFREKNINPIQGVSLNFDGKMGRILAVSGGRVMVDFNHSLAGKPVHYKIKVIKKVDDLNEKIKAFNDFFFRQEFKFSVDSDKKKITLEVDKQFSKVVELFKDKFKEVFDLELEVKEIGEKKEEK